MSWSIPADFGPAIAAFLTGCGDPVTWKQHETAVVLSLVGSVQRPGTRSLVGDVVQDGFLVYLPGDAFGAERPEKFDRMTIDGEDRTVEEAVPIQAGGRIFAWQITCLG